jgi:hypothetical protein
MTLSKAEKRAFSTVSSSTSICLLSKRLAREGEQRCRTDTGVAALDLGEGGLHALEDGGLDLIHGGCHRLMELHYIGASLL